MIILTPITDASKLEHYYRFRYRIYSESRNVGFLNKKEDGLDIDRYDVRARHFGWYLNCELVGCIRFVEPEEIEDALHMLSYMTEKGPRDAVKQVIAECREHARPLIEASRFCLAPEHRGLRTAKLFVLAIADNLHALKIDHALFDCSEQHAAFYSSLGFTHLPQAEIFFQKEMRCCVSTMVFNYTRVAMRRCDPTEHAQRGPLKSAA